MTIILDLDHTLLNATKFKSALEESLVPLGISEEIFRENYKKTVTAILGQYSYDIGRHADLLHQASGIAKGQIVAKLEGALDKLPGLLYPDTKAFLEFLREHKYETSLLTFGNADFQKEKVRRLGIADYFDTMIFAEEGKETIDFKFADAPEKWIFINDNPNEIRKLAARFPQSPMIRVKRTDGKKFPSEEDMLDVPTFGDLDSVRTFLAEHFA